MVSVELNKEECVFLNHALNLTSMVIKGIPLDTDANKLELDHARYALDLVLGVRDNMMENAACNDKDDALLLLNSLYEKVQKGLSLLAFYNR
ncbi:MAG: hypothetical protein ACRD8Z_06895 [Nitrososphaeraceae archaeon]